MVNFSEIFRSLFGSPQERFHPDKLPRNIEEDFENQYGSRPDWLWHQQPPTVHSEWRLFDGHEGHSDFSLGEGDFLQEFEQMFQNFFGGFTLDLNPPMEAPLPLGPPPDMSSEMPEDGTRHDLGQSLQDRMLRRPDVPPGMEHSKDQLGQHAETFPFPPPSSLFGSLFRLPFGGFSEPEDRVDRDFDSEVESGTHSLDDILAQKDEDQSPSFLPHRSSSSSSFSSVTIIGSNGVTEQRTTKRDSSGKEEVTVTRRIGDQTHTFTRRKDETGNEETREDLLNIEHDKLEEFDEKWHDSKSQGQSPRLLEGDGPSRQPTPLSSIYDAVLEQFFPKRR